MLPWVSHCMNVYDYIARNNLSQSCFNSPFSSSHFARTFFSQLFFCVLFWKRSINPSSISVESGEVYTSVFTSEKQGGLWPACRWSETGSRPGTSREARTTARAPSRGLDVTHIRFGIPSRRALRDYHVTTETLGRASPPGGGQGWP